MVYLRNKTAGLIAAILCLGITVLNAQNSDPINTWISEGLNIQDELDLSWCNETKDCDPDQIKRIQQIIRQLSAVDLSDEQNAYFNLLHGGMYILTLYDDHQKQKFNFIDVPELYDSLLLKSVDFFMLDGNTSLHRKALEYKCLLNFYYEINDVTKTLESYLRIYKDDPNSVNRVRIRHFLSTLYSSRDGQYFKTYKLERKNIQELNSLTRSIEVDRYYYFVYRSLGDLLSILELKEYSVDYLENAIRYLDPEVDTPNYVDGLISALMADKELRNDSQYIKYHNILEDIWTSEPGNHERDTIDDLIHNKLDAYFVKYYTKHDSRKAQKIIEEYIEKYKNMDPRTMLNGTERDAVVSVLLQSYYDYIKKENIDNAIEMGVIVDDFWARGEINKERSALLKSLSQLNYQKDNATESNKFRDRYLESIEALQAKNDKHPDESMKIMEDIMKQNGQIKSLSYEHNLSEEKIKKNRYKFGFLSISLSLSLISLFYYLRRLRITQRERRALAKQIEQEKEKNSKLYEKSDYLEEQLSQKLLLITQYKSILIDYEQTLDDLELDAWTKRKLTKELSLPEVQDTIQRLEEDYLILNKAFIKRLRELHPSLSDKLAKLCVLFKMNLSYEQISVLTSSSINSLRTTKSRLKSRFNLSKDESLADYLEKIAKSS